MSKTFREWMRILFVPADKRRRECGWCGATVPIGSGVTTPMQVFCNGEHASDAQAFQGI